MDIENFGQREATKPLHHPMLPDDIRMLVVGQSGCGKTNLVINLILKYIKWTELYVITMTPFQSIYDPLRDLNKKEKCVNFVSPSDLGQELFQSMEPLSLVIFDDYMMVKNQEFPSMVFSQGRHRKINSIYISQKFTETELVIRQNTNILVMFNVDKKSRECVHNMYVSADMDLRDFKNVKLVNRDFLVIQPTRDGPDRYIKNFKHALKY